MRRRVAGDVQIAEDGAPAVLGGRRRRRRRVHRRVEREVHRVRGSTIVDPRLRRRVGGADDWRCSAAGRSTAPSSGPRLAERPDEPEPLVEGHALGERRVDCRSASGRSRRSTRAVARRCRRPSTWRGCCPSRPAPCSSAPIRWAPRTRRSGSATRTRVRPRSGTPRGPAGWRCTSRRPRTRGARCRTASGAACESQRLVSLAGAPAIAGCLGRRRRRPPPPPPCRRPRRCGRGRRRAGPATYSVGGRPMRVIRHSSVSAPPVETAMSGMLSFVSPAAHGAWATRATCPPAALSWQAVTSILNCLRHLPTWMTSGTFEPTGAFVERERPVHRRRRARRPRRSWKSAAQLHASAPVGTPLGKGAARAAHGRHVDGDVVERVVARRVVDLARDGRRPAAGARDVALEARRTRGPAAREPPLDPPLPPKDPLLPPLPPKDPLLPPLPPPPLPPPLLPKPLPPLPPPQPAVVPRGNSTRAPNSAVTRADQRARANMEILRAAWDAGAS